MMNRNGMQDMVLQKDTGKAFWLHGGGPKLTKTKWKRSNKKGRKENDDENKRLGRSEKAISAGCKRSHGPDQ